MDMLQKDTSLKERIKGYWDKYVTGERLSCALFIIGPVLSYTLVEMLNNNSPWAHLSTLQIVLNLLWYYIIYGLAFAVIGRVKLAAGGASVIFFLIGNINHYLYAFRGRTLFPGDLLSIGTAVNVAGNYSYAPSSTQVMTFIIFALYMAALIGTPHIKGRRRLHLKSAVPALVLTVLYSFTFFCTGFLSSAGVEPSMWTTTGNGLVLNFLISLRYSRGAKPEGFNEAALAQATSDVTLHKESEGITPTNIIAIMNESFSDPGVLGEVPANRDWMPYWRAMDENVIKGYAYSSVFGGTTANSEYEFLTGNSVSFLPPGTVPFQLYIDERSTSIVGQLGELGYKKVAMHPYLPSGWNRPVVYKHFGFDEVYFKDDFKRRKFLRNYVSDRTNYDNVIRIFEEKEEGEKLFVFNVTMQNHGAFNVDYKGLRRTVWLTDELKGEYPTVDQYLSLIKESDEAFDYLLSYFKDVEEPTMILMFGDHQAKIGDGFYEYMLGGGLDELDTEVLQNRYKVPFCIWTNYDIEEQDGLELSINYLSSLMFEKANLPMTEYQSFLYELRKDLPIINVLGFDLWDGTHYDSADELPEPVCGDVEKYRILQYANMFEPEAVTSGFFEVG